MGLWEGRALPHREQLILLWLVLKTFGHVIICHMTFCHTKFHHKIFSHMSFWCFNLPSWLTGPIVRFVTWQICGLRTVKSKAYYLLSVSSSEKSIIRLKLVKV